MTESVDEDAPYKGNVTRLSGSLFFFMSTMAITLGPLYDAYLLNVGGNMLVGGMTSVLGIIQLVLAFPIGWIADRMSRIKLLRLVLPLWTLGLGLIIAGVVSDTIPLILAGICCWSPCSQTYNNTAQVLIADWSPPSRRTASASNFTTTRLISNSIGPLLQVILLVSLGRRDWDNGLLHVAVACGAVMWPGVWLCIFSLKDLPAFEKTVRGQSAAPAFRVEDLDHRFRGVAVRWWVAISLEVVSLVVSMGAGMTIKFFPLFFRVDYGFTPVQVCLLSFASPLSIAVMVQVCARLSKRLGRLRSIMLFHFLGTSCLWAMVFVKSIWVLLPLFFFRGAFMNARGPIVRAIIMDLVPSDRRGRWNSIQSVQSFTWAGSAFLGGYFADRFGDYRATFVVTAIVYTSAFFCLLPLFLIYPAEIAVRERNPSGSATADASVQLLEARHQAHLAEAGEADGSRRGIVLEETAVAEAQLVEAVELDLGMRPVEETGVATPTVVGADFARGDIEMDPWMAASAEVARENLGDSARKVIAAPPS